MTTENSSESVLQRHLREAIPDEVVIYGGHHITPQVSFPEVSGMSLVFPTYWLVFEHSMAPPEKCSPGLGGVYLTALGAQMEVQRCLEAQAQAHAWTERKRA